MNRRLLRTLAVAAVILAPATALATGFSIYEAGSRATALGCAFTATADDGSAMFYNAAGLSFIEGQTFDVNAMVIRPDFKFSGWLSQGDYENGDPAETGEAEKKSYFVPGAYYTNNDGEKLAYGIGLYAPFGLGVVWQDPENWVGRRVSHDVSIETVYVSPSVSYMAAEGLALALSLDVAHTNLSLSRFTPEPDFGTNAIETEIEGSSSINITPAFGVMYRPDDRLSLGLMYHFRKTMNFEDGDAALTPQGTAASNPWGHTLVDGLGGIDQKVSTELELPSIMSLGLSYRLTEQLRAEVNYVRFGWGTLEGLTLDFDNDNLDQDIHLGYENSWQIRAGAEYAVNEKWSLMGGYVKDNSPQPTESVSPLLPDSDRNDYSLGIMYHGEKYDLNFSFMTVIGDERSNIVDGEPVRNGPDYPIGNYTAVANIFGVGFTYHF